MALNVEKTPKLYKTTGEILDVLPANRKCFSSEELKAFVGGWFEFAELYDGRMMVVSEEGKLLHQTGNAKATSLFLVGRAWFDFIAGDALVCPPEYLEMEEADEA